MENTLGKLKAKLKEKIKRKLKHLRKIKTPSKN